MGRTGVQLLRLSTMAYKQINTEPHSLWEVPVACVIRQLLQDGISKQSSLSVSVASYTKCRATAKAAERFFRFTVNISLLQNDYAATLTDNCMISSPHGWEVTVACWGIAAASALVITLVLVSGLPLVCACRCI